MCFQKQLPVLRVIMGLQQTEHRPWRMDVGVCGCRAEALQLNIG